MEDRKFEFFENGANRVMIERLFEQYWRLLPAWVLNIKVQEQGQGEGGRVLDIRALTDYRSVCISVYDIFWRLEEVEQKNAILHEWAHLWTSELCAFVNRRLLTALGEDETALRDVLEKEFEDRVERMTTDFAHMLSRLPGVLQPAEFEYPRMMTPTKQAKGA